MKNIDNNYELIKQIGRGTFGDVYMARKKQQSIFVALKIIKLQQNSAEQIQSLENEIKILKDIQHPNIIQLIDYSIKDDKLYIATELGEQDMFQMLNQQKQLNIQQLQQISYQSLQALAFLHSKQIAHRDFKSSNLIVFSDGSVKLGDLGFARYFDQNMTSLKGSPAYLAPEIAQGVPYTCKSDCFSACSTFYELATGRSAIQANNYIEIIKKLCSQDLEIDFSDDIFKLNPEFTDFLQKGLQINPDKRYSADQLLHHVWFKELNQIYEKEKQQKESQDESEDDFDETIVDVVKQNQKEQLITLKSQNKMIQFIIDCLIEKQNLNQYSDIIDQDLLLLLKKYIKLQNYIQVTSNLYEFIHNQKLQGKIQSYVQEQLNIISKQQININFNNVLLLCRLYMLLFSQVLFNQTQNDYPLEVYYNTEEELIVDQQIFSSLTQLLSQQIITDQYIKTALINIYLCLQNHNDFNVNQIMNIITDSNIDVQVIQLKQYAQSLIKTDYSNEQIEKCVRLLSTKQQYENIIQYTNHLLVTQLLEYKEQVLFQNINYSQYDEIDMMQHIQQPIHQYMQDYVQLQLYYLYFQPYDYKIVLQSKFYNQNNQIKDNLNRKSLQNSPYKYILEQFKMTPRQTYVYANQKFGLYFKDNIMDFNIQNNYVQKIYTNTINKLCLLASKYNIQHIDNKNILQNLLSQYDDKSGVLLLNDQYLQNKERKIDCDFIENMYQALCQQQKFQQSVSQIEVSTTTGKQFTIAGALLIEIQSRGIIAPQKLLILSQLLTTNNMNQIAIQLGQQYRIIINSLLQNLQQKFYVRFEQIQVKYQQTWKNNVEYHQTDLGSQIIINQQEYNQHNSQVILSVLQIMLSLIQQRQINQPASMQQYVKNLTFNILYQHIYQPFDEESLIEAALTILSQFSLQWSEICLITAIIKLQLPNSKQRQQFALFTMKHNKKSILECILDSCPDCLCLTNGAGITQQQALQHMSSKTLGVQNSGKSVGVGDLISDKSSTFQYCYITIESVIQYTNIISTYVKSNKIISNSLEIFAVLSQMLQFCQENYQYCQQQQFQQAVLQINMQVMNIIRKSQNLSLIIAVLAEYNFIYYDLNCVKYIDSVQTYDLIIATVDQLVNLNNPLINIFRCQLKQAGVIQQQFINQIFNMITINKQYNTSKTINLLLNIIHFTLEYNNQDSINIMPYLNPKFAQQIIFTKNVKLINEYYRLAALVINQVKYSDNKLYQLLEFTISLIVSELELIQKNNLVELQLTDIIAIWNYIYCCLTSGYYSYTNIICYIIPLIILLLKFDQSQDTFKQNSVSSIYDEQNRPQIKFAVKKQLINIVKLCNFYYMDITKRQIKLDIQNYDYNMKCLKTMILQYLKQNKMNYDSLSKTAYVDELQQLQLYGLIDQQTFNALLV